MKVRFYTVTNQTGGEYIFLQRIAKKFGDEVEFFWDHECGDVNILQNRMWTKLLIKALNTVDNISRIGKFYLFSHFVPATYVLPDESINIVSSAFMPFPKSKTFIAYIMTPDRNLTINYNKNKERYRQASLFKYFGFRMLNTVYRYIFLKTLRKANMVLTVSQTVQSRLKEYMGVESQVLSLSIDVSEFRKADPENYFIYPSRLARAKRQDYAIRAFEVFYQKNKNYRLIIATPELGSGDAGTYYNELKELVCGKNLPVIFKFNPSRDELADLYAKSIACLFCAEDEDFGLVPLEAMASYRPVISVNEGGPRETIVNGKTGFLVNSVEEMAERMEFLVRYPNKASEMGLAGRHHVESNFDDAIFVERLKAWCQQNKFPMM